MALRFVIVCVLTFAFYVFYYKFNPVLLGQQAGYSNPLQYPLAATSLIVVLLLMHNWFFDLAPGYRLANRAELLAAEEEAEKEPVAQTTNG